MWPNMTKYYKIVDQDLILISLFCIQKSAMKLFRFEMAPPPPPFGVSPKIHLFRGERRLLLCWLEVSVCLLVCFLASCVWKEKLTDGDGTLVSSLQSHHYLKIHMMPHKWFHKMHSSLKGGRQILLCGFCPYGQNPQSSIWPCPLRVGMK